MDSPGLPAVRVIPAGSTVDSLFGIMATHTAGKPKLRLSAIYPTTGLVPCPMQMDMIAINNYFPAGELQTDHSDLPFEWQVVQAQVDSWVAAQAGAMPWWQKRAVAAEGKVLYLRGKFQEAEWRAHEAERRATTAEQRAAAAERDRNHLRAQARKSKPKAGARGQQQVEQMEGWGGQGQGGGGAVRGTLWRGARPRRPKQ